MNAWRLPTQTRAHEDRGGVQETRSAEGEAVGLLQGGILYYKEDPCRRSALNRGGGRLQRLIHIL